MTRIHTASTFETTDEPGRGLDLLERFAAVRRQTELLCEPLEPEDFVVQSMPDASPAKWHLAHTTWFFETFVLASALPDYQSPDPRYNFLFNSYYNAVGERLARDRRGLMTRPTIGEVEHYRRIVDERVGNWLTSVDPASLARLEPIVVLGLHHEQQHQELLVTDIKHALASNPFEVIYRKREADPAGPAPSLRWISFEERVTSIGHNGPGFAFDNESPRHKVFAQGFTLANRPATNAEYLAFIEGGGYRRAEFWLSDGWNAVNKHGWIAPLYWNQGQDGWNVATLAGQQKIRPEEPVTHLSFYEADAFARWSGARLPTEAEWEIAARDTPIEGNLLESGRLHPNVAPDPVKRIGQVYGDVWEWTQSPYTAYPGYRPAAGALGEYNGKFMCNTFVLRGGSCATPASHIRPTYRNFFGPEARWQYTGVRLAKDLD